MVSSFTIQQKNIYLHRIKDPKALEVNEIYTGPSFAKGHQSS